MMSDRELLELAAKAAGVDGKWLGDGSLWIGPYDGGNEWSPLTDDGDALRLAVKLGILCWRDDDIIWCNGVNSVVGTNPYADVRAAIVRAAAEIGKHHVE